MEASLLPIFIVLLVVDWFFAKQNQSSLHKVAGARTTHVWDVLSMLFFVLGIRRLLSNLFFFGFIAFLMGFIPRVSVGVFENMSLWIQLPLAMLIYDFLFYWGHRLKHSSLWLWNVHEFHHSATEITTFTDFRVHPLDFLVHFIITLIPLYWLFGADPTFFMAFRFVSAVPGYFVHSRIDTDLGWLGKIFVSPRFHQLHHEMESNNKSCNFSNCFSIWDKMFGTYQVPSRSIFDLNPGLQSNQYDQAISWRSFVEPVTAFYKYPLLKIKHIASLRRL